MSFPEFDAEKRKVLFFSRGRGRGHAVPDVEIARSLSEGWDIELRFVSYATGARTLEELGYSVIDLGQPDIASVADVTALAGRLIGWLRPDLVVSHEEFAALPVAKVFDCGTLFVTDWFIEAETYEMQTLKFADEIAFIGARGVFAEPPTAAGKVRYVGPIVRRFEYSRTDRARARLELGLPANCWVACVLPGSWTEAESPILELVLRAFDQLKEDPKILLWMAGDDLDTIREACAGRPDVVIRSHDWAIDRIAAAADVAVTKGTRKTIADLEALCLPSVAISHGRNRIDDRAVAALHSTRLMRAADLNPGKLAAALLAQARVLVPSARQERPDGARGCAALIQSALERRSAKTQS